MWLRNISNITGDNKEHKETDDGSIRLKKTHDKLLTA